LRILLTSNASYAPPRGGSTRSNLAWLRHLAGSGHRCVVVCAAITGPRPSEPGSSAAGPDHTIHRDDIEIRSVHDFARRTSELGRHIREVQPDWVLVSSEDLSHVLLREAEQAAAGRVIYLAHTPQFFPFGPESWNRDARATDIVRRARAVVAIGHHVAGYIREHTGVIAHVIHPPIYTAPKPAPAGAERRWVLMINPCLVKGIDIFASVAQRFRDVPFAALIGWGTTSADKDRLAALPNVQLLASVPDIDDVLSRTRVLLMPSIWYEGFGLIAMEAMLRGVPVIASDSGGLKEAKQGTGFVIPVRPVERYLSEFDETHMPVPVRPEQDIEPWVAALEKLLSDRDAYDAEVRRSLERAVPFVSRLNAADFEHLLARELKPGLRILLAHNSLYYPSHGGGDKSNRLLMEALAARGHRVRVVARIERFDRESQSAFIETLRERGVNAAERHGGVARFALNGVEVRTLTGNPNMRELFASEVRDFDPDVIITSTDDPAQLLFGIAANAERARVVHLVRATIAVPFGPDASSPSPARTEALRRADAVVGVSEYVARYVREHGQLPAVHVPISLLEGWPAPEALGRFDNEYVTFANPCAVKGIDIFLGLAGAMPDVRFAAVPTWGTNAHDMEALRACPNITIVPPVDNMDDLFRRTRVLLVPSVWAEARSRIVVEAMLRGVPVIASDIGGIPEAKLGVPYLLPVNSIRCYKPAVDENMVPVAEVPPQDIGPWENALRRLTTDEAHWREIAGQSRRAALEYLRTLSVAPFESVLRKAIASERPSLRPAPSGLTDDRRRLLALRLKQRSAAKSPWFPVLDPLRSGQLRLFCFAHAGAGTLLYRSWRDPLAHAAAVTPTCRPGREHRMHEPVIDDMTELVAALHAAIRPHLGEPFAFFGHSMGAAVAFELARALRRAGDPLPIMLIASAARAPQFRFDWTPPPDPSDAEFLEELRRFEGVREEVLNDPEALRVVMPALKGDARLYRRYIYTPESSFDYPIVTYTGAADPNIRPEHAKAWAGQTTASFTHREFPGGHFYIQTARDTFLTSLLFDLSM
jgi:surfactin synthase thioesterase subunit/glycosyltransferase involved in cell wall biosynthesis